MFSGLTNVNDIKKRYRQLCFVYHPDVGGSDEQMKELNRLYQEALARCDGFTTMGNDGKEHTYHYNADIEKGIMDKIDELLKMRLAGVKIMLVGYWVWISGDTKPVKERLKQAQCRWHSKRGMWYWHNEGYRSRYSNKDFSDICKVYGMRQFEDEEKSIVVAG